MYVLLLLATVRSEVVDGGVGITRSPFIDEFDGRGDGMLYLQVATQLNGRSAVSWQGTSVWGAGRYLRCSSGTLSASMRSHCVARWRTQRAHASTRPPRAPRHGKCMACEFMYSAEVDSHSIDCCGNSPAHT